MRCFIVRDCANWSRFNFDVGGREVGQVVVGLLGEPRFGDAAEDFGEADDHIGRDAEFLLISSERVVRVTPSAAERWRVKSEEGHDASCPYGENQETSRALGFFLAMARSFRATWRGRRVPCSQLRTALGLTFG